MKNENILYADPTWNKKGKAITQVPSLDMNGKKILSKYFPLCFGFRHQKEPFPKPKPLHPKTTVYSCQFGRQGLWFLDVMVVVLGCLVSFWEAKKTR